MGLNLFYLGHLKVNLSTSCKQKLLLQGITKFMCSFELPNLEFSFRITTYNVYRQLRTETLKFAISYIITKVKINSYETLRGPDELLR